MKRQASAVLLILTAAWLLPDLVRCGVSPAAAAVDDRKPDAKTGTFRGLVIFDGTPPERETLLKKDDPKVKPDDRATCAADDQLSEDFLVNEEAGNGVANAVIYLQRAPDDYVSPPLPEEPVSLEVKACRYVPHVCIIRCGQTLLVKSDDLIPHHEHFSDLRNSGFGRAIKPRKRGEGAPYTFKNPEPRPIEVACDFHPWMKAYCLPLDHPFVAVTDKEGRFEIERLPAGKHTFTIWHERPGYLQRELRVDIEADKVTEKMLTFKSSAFVKPILPASGSSPPTNQRKKDLGHKD